MSRRLESDRPAHFRIERLAFALAADATAEEEMQ